MAEKVIDKGAPAFSAKNLISIIVAALVFCFFQFVCPTPEGLGHTGISAIGILVTCIVLWVTESLPFIVTVVFIFAALPMTGILPYSSVTGTLSSDIVSATGATLAKEGASVTITNSVFNSSSLLVPVYCLFVFTVSGIVMSTPLPYRVAAAALKVCKSSRVLIIALMFATSICSMFISDLAASAIFIGIGLAIVEANGGIKGQSGLAKALTVGIGSAAAIGGIGTPIGNSLNILCATMINTYLGVQVSFGAWCVICIPLALVASLCAGLYVSTVFKCETLNPEALTVVTNKLEEYGPFSVREIKFIIWFVIAFGIMIASTWVTTINSMYVAFIFTIIAFIPGIDLLTKEAFHGCIAWEIIMMIIGVQALATGLVGTGAASWFVKLCFADAVNWDPMIIILVMCVVTMILHIAIPVGPPTVSVAIPLMVAVVTLVGVDKVHPGILACIGGVLGGVTTWIPIDSIMMLTYEHGWCTMGEWVSRGWGSTVILLILTWIWLPIIVPIMVPLA